MDGRNINEIMRQDPSLQGGKMSKVFDRHCSVEMKIIEMNILQMVGQDVTSTEDLQFKILVKNRERLPIKKGEETIDFKSNKDRNTISGIDARLNDTLAGRSAGNNKPAAPQIEQIPELSSLS